MAGLTAKAGEARELIPTGNYFGVIIGIYDLGSQESQYGPRQKVKFEIELHKKKGPVVDKKGFTLRAYPEFSMAFGVSNSGEKSKLRAAVESIIGRAFTEQEASDGYDLTQLLDVCCRVTVAHDTSKQGKKYEGFTFTPMDEDDPQPKTESDTHTYEVDPAKPIPDYVPAFIAKRIRQSTEWTKVHGDPNTNGRTGKAPVKSGSTARHNDSDDDGDDDEIAF